MKCSGFGYPCPAVRAADGPPLVHSEPRQGNVSANGGNETRPPGPPPEGTAEVGQTKTDNSLDTWIIAKGKASQNQRALPLAACPRAKLPIQDKSNKQGLEPEFPILDHPGGVPRSQIRYRKINITGFQNSDGGPFLKPPKTMRPLLPGTGPAKGKQRLDLDYTGLCTPPPSLGPVAHRGRGFAESRSGKYGYRSRTVFNPRTIQDRSPAKVRAEVPARRANGTYGRVSSFKRGGHNHDVFASQFKRRTVPAQQGVIRYPAASGDSNRLGNQHTMGQVMVDGGRSSMPHPKSQTQKVPPKSGLPTDDPQASIARGRSSPPASTSRGAHRVRTELLTPERGHQKTLNVIPPLNFDAQGLMHTLNIVVAYDTFVNKGSLDEGLSMTIGSTDVADVDCRLRVAVSRWLGTMGKEPGAVQINLLGCLKEKSTQKN